MDANYNTYLRVYFKILHYLIIFIWTVKTNSKSTLLKTKAAQAVFQSHLSLGRFQLGHWICNCLLQVHGLHSATHFPCIYWIMHRFSGTSNYANWSHTGFFYPFSVIDVNVFAVAIYWLFWLHGEYHNPCRSCLRGVVISQIDREVIRDL